MASYPFPWDLFLALARDLPAGRRSLRADSARLLERIDPPPAVTGVERVPCTGAVVIAANHYQRRGLWIGWPGVVATVAVAGRRTEDIPVHWLATGGLRLFQAADRGPVVPGTRWIFRRVASIYGMTPLPPDRPVARAHALRSWLRHAEHGHVLGLFPEGLAGRHAGLRRPEQGFPRLCRILADRSVPVVPLGCYEHRRVLHLDFGQALPARPELSAEEQSDRIMYAIAALLPCELRGAYGGADAGANRGALG